MPDIPQQELVIVLVFLASNVVVVLLRALKVDWDPIKVNAGVSAAIGVGVALLAQGEPLVRVLVGAAAAAISALAAVAIHRTGRGVQAITNYVSAAAEHKRAEANGAVAIAKKVRGESADPSG